jgi:hypothetical protein
VRKADKGATETSVFIADPLPPPSREASLPWLARRDIRQALV